MPTKRNSRKGIQARLKRALASIDARSSKFPNIPRSGYELEQQTAWVKNNPRAFDRRKGFSTANVHKMIDYGENQYSKRRQQLIDAANRLMAKASNGG